MYIPSIDTSRTSPTALPRSHTMMTGSDTTIRCRFRRSFMYPSEDRSNRVGRTAFSRATVPIVEAPPNEGTVERWAWDYIRATSLSAKVSPPSPPDRWDDDGAPIRLETPGRPAELRVVRKAKKTRGLQGEEGRARALHSFWHHELQAAE